ncbi:hypothetical protein, partial [Methyloglobulus morosus]|uniref:hypothetical protein n=1 Tax=Methyloglobulus morosus TaxID=1410681 RepID=UPI001F20B8C8
MSEPFVLSPSTKLRRALSKHTPPFDRLKANGNLKLHKAESIVLCYVSMHTLGSVSPNLLQAKNDNGDSPQWSRQILAIP